MEDGFIRPRAKWVAGLTWEAEDSFGSGENNKSDDKEEENHEDDDNDHGPWAHGLWNERRK